MRLALLIVGCCGVGAAGPCRPQDATLPAESSFITKLANEAINADGPEAIGNREQSLSIFVGSFLMGYANPGSTIPVNEARYFSRMNGRGWNAGQAYRSAHPESVAQIMREYGFREFAGRGSWNVGFEAGDFEPDAAAVNSVGGSREPCWELALMHTPQLDAQLRRVVPHDVLLHGAILHVRVKGYVSQPGTFGRILEIAPDGKVVGGSCQRRLYALSVSAYGG